MAQGCLAALLFCVTVAVNTAASPRQPLACQASGMCSIGHSKPYLGDIKAGAALRSFVSHVAYKNELIVAPHKRGDAPEFDNEALQWWQELRALGYAHMALTATTADDCRGVRKVEPDVSCVWDSTEIKISKYLFEHFMHFRWRVLARLLRLGLNVLSLDNDVIMLGDFYAHVRHPSLQKRTMLSRLEGFIPSVNLGFVYIKGAAVDGPVTWGMRFIAELLLRQMDDDAFWEQMRGKKSSELCLSFDQALQGSAFATLMVGRQQWDVLFQLCTPNFPEGDPRQQLKKQRCKALDHQLSWQRRTSEVYNIKPLPELMPLPHNLDQLDWTHAMHFDLVLPNLAIPWSPELGGKLLPDPGPYSLAFHQQLKEDCQACPWWDEQRPLPFDRLPVVDTSQPMNLTLYHDAAGTKHKEVLQQTPEWFVTSAFKQRRAQVWGPAWPQPSVGVLNHVHVWPLNARGKMQLRKLYGRYNYSTAQAAAGRPYTLEQTPSHVLALSPQLDLGYTRNWTEVAAILTGLVQVALLTDRAVVFPTLPCHTPWLHSPQHDAPGVKPDQVCTFPALAGHEHAQQPLPLPLRTDHRGELLGGWTGGYDGELPAAQIDLAAAAPGRLVSGVSGAARTAALQGRDWTARLSGPDAAASGPALEQIRVTFPMLWDVKCSILGMRGLIVPELFHWLSSSASGGARLEPSPNNTALTLDPAAEQLRPWPVRQQPPGSQAQLFATSQTGVLQAQSTHGWSLADVQVGLHVGVAARELARFKDEPLLYLAHPVALLPPRRPKSKWAAKYQHIINTMEQTSCRAFKVPSMKPVAWNWDRPATLDVSGTPSAAVGAQGLRPPSARERSAVANAAPVSHA